MPIERVMDIRIDCCGNSFLLGGSEKSVDKSLVEQSFSIVLKDHGVAPGKNMKGFLKNGFPFLGG
jgi:hypothetical protein